MVKTIQSTMEDDINIEFETGVEEPRLIFSTSTGLQLFAEPDHIYGFWVISCYGGGNNRVPEKLADQRFTSIDKANSAIEHYLNTVWYPAHLSKKNRTYEKKQEKQEPGATASRHKR